MLSTDLATFGAIYSTHGSLWRCQYLMCVFPRHFVAPHHPQPTTPMESLVVLVKKLSKMAGNSASKPLNSTPNELPCITVEWWRIAWKKLYAFSRYTAFNISNRYFSIFVIARIRPLLANPVTYSKQGCLSINYKCSLRWSGNSASIKLLSTSLSYYIDHSHYRLNRKEG